MAIKVNNLEKKYRTLTVLHGISLEIPQGSIATIIGPSGSGKSTLLRCLNHLEKPDSGSIQINGFVFESAKASKASIKELQSKSAMVFQHYNLFKNKTALENVTEGLIIGQKMDPDQANAMGKELLDRVGLTSSHYDKYPVTLSGGEQQRVGIARALAVNPEVLLFDEPTSALDPEKVGEVLDVIRDVVKTSSATFILVTHEMEFAQEVSDCVYFMDKGKIVEFGKPKDIFNNPIKQRTKDFLKNFN